MNKLKSMLGLIILILATLMFAQEPETSTQNGTTLRLMTYNIKFASPTFEPSWKIRRDMQIDLIRQYDPDIIGMQEGLKEQVDYLMEHLPEYVVVGEGRQGGDASSALGAPRPADDR